LDDPTLPNYHATHRCLLTIGDDEKTVLKRVNDTKADGVEVVGLVASQAHDSYRMYVKLASSLVQKEGNPRPQGPSLPIQGPFFIRCDHVAKALQVDDAGVVAAVVSAQELGHIDSAKFEGVLSHVGFCVSVLWSFSHLPSCLFAVFFPSFMHVRAADDQFAQLGDNVQMQVRAFCSVWVLLLYPSPSPSLSTLPLPACLCFVSASLYAASLCLSA
jgi:hypothetical protein